MLIDSTHPLPRTTVAFLVAVLSAPFLLPPRQSPLAAQQTGASPQAPAKPSTRPSRKPASQDDTESDPDTDAERIARLQQIIQEDRQRLDELRSELETLKSRTEEQSATVMQLESSYVEQEQKIEDLPQEAADENAKQLRQKLSELGEQRREAHEAFNLVIQRRKATQSQIATLEQKIELEERALNRLLGVEPEPEEPVDEPAGEEPPATPLAEPVTTPEADSTDDASAPATPAPTADEASRDAVAPRATPFDPRVQAARRKLEVKQQALDEAEQRVERLNEAVDVVAENISNEQQLLENASQEVQLARERLAELRSRLNEQTDSGASEDELAAMQQQIEETSRQLTTTIETRDSHAERVATLESQLAAVQEESDEAIEQLQEIQSEVDSASRWLRFMESPVAPHRIADWLIYRGPTILFIVLLLVVLRWLIRLIVGRSVRGLVRHSRSGRAEDREERAQTIIGVANSLTTIVILGTGLLVVLDHAGIDVTVLLGGAAALGVAVGFGAQNLMKDFFYGSMILAENQYRVGNVVRIAGIAGLVESISLRRTVLRDLEGIVHFIPHSQITTVSNLTQGWSRAVLDIGVAYKEDVDHVMQVLQEVAQGLREDVEFRHLTVEDPEILGVEALGDSAVVIKLLIKTRPLQQWTVRRELLRRIKNRFDELGIEIPFPHRTIYHRQDLSEADAVFGTAGD
ncbi:putative MscS family protein YkuT [Maioricimonas rarisocia]|uniref:Putative MscS family protein YkuT n=1 Tax=Maioricimonas rarisocia TaxID=2528026 RepID=A0A517ZDC9_9PLAN|nr:mechanosensitive ion channel family protein [Maioricimonas rarisocia]QDU40477.1 putative MscS family protein YkuT [Maioricimonas rarisocia]